MGSEIQTHAHFLGALGARSLPAVLTFAHTGTVREMTEVCTTGQAEQTKYEARIVGLQRAKQEAAAKAEAQSQKATLLQQDLDRLTTERARFVCDLTSFMQRSRTRLSTLPAHPSGVNLHVLWYES